MSVDIKKIGLFTHSKGRVLLCRKRGLESLILPGGRLEPGESALECLCREIQEELGAVTVEALEALGVYADAAASQPDKIVEILLYHGQIKGAPIASSEIEELVWFGSDSDASTLSPILARKIFPDLQRRGLLPW